MSRPRPVTYTVSGRAQRWVKVLVDFGHVEPATLDRLYLTAADLAAAEGLRPDRPLEVAHVRRAAAMLLHPVGDDEPLHPHLEEDWPILFS